MFKFGVAICIPFFVLNFNFAQDISTSNVEKNSTSMLKTLKQMNISFSGDEYEIENLSKLDDKMQKYHCQTKLHYMMPSRAI